MIGTVLDHLRPEDVELLLANRGLPSAGCKEDLADRLQSALQAEICEWEWESGDVPDFHCGNSRSSKVVVAACNHHKQQTHHTTESHNVLVESLCDSAVKPTQQTP